MLSELPIEHVKVEDLPAIVKLRRDALKKVPRSLQQATQFLTSATTARYTWYMPNPQTTSSEWTEKNTTGHIIINPLSRIHPCLPKG